MIPAEAVEAAARVHQDLRARRGYPGWDALAAAGDSGQQLRLEYMRAALEAAAPHMLGPSTVVMEIIIREHWAAEVPHPMYPTYVQCMKQGCEWSGRFPGDIAEHVAALIASEKP